MENYATKNTDVFLSARRFPEYEEIGICRREPFQRDRDRIMHSRSFRRMMHKTQIFNANMGDHYRNRLTHTLEVAQISRSIGKVLGLNDELIEAIALGHDLGHTPFGHIGERTLDGILHNGLNTNIPATGGRFKHNFLNILAQKSEAKFEMAFDHVTYQDDSGHKAYDYQIEIELKSDYIHRVNLKMLTDDLERKVSKLESSTESKYKRGLTKLSVQ